MVKFLEIITTFPVVIFTVAAATSLGYWVLSTLLGFGDMAFDSDVDLDTNLDSDAEPGIGGLDGEASAGLLSTLGLKAAPLSIVITVCSLVGWAVSMFAILTIGRGGLLFSLAVVAVALLVGLVVAGRIAKLIAPLFVTVRATRHEELVGRLCVVRTSRIDDSFGQAEVSGPNGEDHFVQIRCLEKNSLTLGSQALVVDVDDDGIFTVSPDVSVIGD